MLEALAAHGWTVEAEDAEDQWWWCGCSRRDGRVRFVACRPSSPTSPSAPGTVTLGEDAAHHMRVRRLETGVRVGLLDGAGTRGEGVLTQLAKRHAVVSVEQAEQVEPAPAVHLLLPVADKDRMLWLAEKATELELSSWRPVLYRRSKHVNPRGEGPTFQQKVRGRMAAALEQSRGAHGCRCSIPRRRSSMRSRPVRRRARRARAGWSEPVLRAHAAPRRGAIAWGRDPCGHDRRRSRGRVRGDRARGVRRVGIRACLPRPEHPPVRDGGTMAGIAAVRARCWSWSARRTSANLSTE